MGFRSFPPRSEITRLSYLKSDKGVSTYTGGSYCGPGWGFTHQDILDGKISAMPAALDAIDEACRLHDQCYHDNGWLTQGCNLVLTVDLVKVVASRDSSVQQRLDATLMAAIFFIESQTVDVGKMAYDEVNRVRERLLGAISKAGASLEHAIIREMSRRHVVPLAP